MRNSSVFIVWTLILLAFGCTPRQAAQSAGTQGSTAGRLDNELQNLTGQMITSLVEQKKSKIAIIEFRDLNGKVSEFGKYLAEEMITRLFRSGRFEVVERQLLNKVLDEQKLGMSGMIDNTTAAQIGQILGVDAIATGTVTDMGKTLRVNARLIATESGKVFSVAAGNVTKSEQVLALLSRTRPQPVLSEKTEPGPQPADEILQEIESGGFLFRITSCEASADRNLTLKLEIINREENDRDLSFLDKTRLFDDRGREFQVNARSIGNKRKERYAIRHLMIGNITNTLVLEFRELPSDTRSIALLELYLYGAGQREWKVGFRNIPIQWL